MWNKRETFILRLMLSSNLLTKCKQIIVIIIIITYFFFIHLYIRERKKELSVIRK